MKDYKRIVRNVLENGSKRYNRTGIDTISIFSDRFIHDMSLGFPICTSKFVPFNAVKSELVWFLAGLTNVDSLREITYGLASKRKTIWDDNYQNQGIDLGYTKGELGPIYGKQWRNFSTYSISEHGNLIEQQGIDQILELLKEAKNNPNSRRLLVSAWNPLALHQMSLPPCHWSFEIYIDGDFIDLKWHQRSVDTFLGLPFNISSYGLLLCIFASYLGKTPRTLEGDLTNVHIYENHIPQCKKLLENKRHILPTLEITRPLTDLDFRVGIPMDTNLFNLLNYEYTEKLTGEMAV